MSRYPDWGDYELYNAVTVDEEEPDDDEWLSRSAYVEWEDRWYLDFTEEGWEADADAQAICAAELFPK